jgi:hypothetical protein
MGGYLPHTIPKQRAIVSPKRGILGGQERKPVNNIAWRSEGHILIPKNEV